MRPSIFFDNFRLRAATIWRNLPKKKVLGLCKATNTNKRSEMILTSTRSRTIMGVQNVLDAVQMEVTMCVLWVLPRVRRPIWVGSRLGQTDLQGALPRSWCSACGTEVFMWGAERCPRCEKEVRNVHKKGLQSL